MQTITRRMARAVGAMSLLAAMFAVSVVPVAADPSTPTTLVFTFTECLGPTGLLPDFSAVKQPGDGAALHLTDGRGIFVAVAATDAVSGVVLFATPGFEHNGLPTIACLLEHPVTHRMEAVVGMLTPVR
jgi:hypothetical protein